MSHEHRYTFTQDGETWECKCGAPMPATHRHIKWTTYQRTVTVYVGTEPQVTTSYQRSRELIQ